MSRRQVLLAVALVTFVLLGPTMMETPVSAVASSTTTSPTVPGQLTTQFPLGSQRLCCRSTSHSQTSPAPPARGGTPSGTAPANGSSAGAGSSGGAGHAASGGTGAAVWIALGAAIAALVATGVAGARRRHREHVAALAPGLPAGPEATSAAATGPRTASASASQEPRYRQSDRDGEPDGAFNLGVLLHNRGDIAGAMTAYERAEERGDPDAAFNLGVLLYETGDLDGAEAAWQRSVERGHPRAAANLVFLAHRHRPEAGEERERSGVQPRGGEHPEVIDELLYRRADERGEARGAFNLGVVLHQRGDVTDAMAAYRRAEQRGDPDAAFNLGVLLYEVGDLDGAEASWRRSARRGHPRASDNLAFAVRHRRGHETAAISHHGADQ